MTDSRRRGTWGGGGVGDTRGFSRGAVEDGHGPVLEEVGWVGEAGGDTWRELGREVGDGLFSNPGSGRRKKITPDDKEVPRPDHIWQIVWQTWWPCSASRFAILRLCPI